jgi:hypothetical protein
MPQFTRYIGIDYSGGFKATVQDVKFSASGHP